MEMSFKDIGKQFKKERLAQKLAVRDVAVGIKFRTKYIKAIEEGEFGQLPGNIFIAGYLKTYADYLGLDSDDILEQFKEAGGDIDQKEFELPAVYSDDTTPSLTLVLIAVLSIIAVYAAWYWLNYEAPEQTAADESLKQEQAALPDKQIILLAKAPVMVDLYSAEGEFIIGLAMQTGDTHFMTRDSLMMVTTAPEKLEIFVDDHMVPSDALPRKEDGRIILSADDLLKL